MRLGEVAEAGHEGQRFGLVSGVTGALGDCWRQGGGGRPLLWRAGCGVSSWGRTE